MNDRMRLRFDEMLRAISICDKQELDMPAIILTYSLLDSLAWTVFEEEIGKVGERFEHFCTEFVLPGSNLPCNANELYAARCSTLHVLGWESNLSKKGTRALFYGHRGANLEIAQKAADKIAPGKFLAVDSTQLRKAASIAVDRVIEKSLTDPDLLKRLERANLSQYRDMPIEKADKLLDPFLNISKGEKNA